jgi:hypothetical protein
LSRSYRGEDRQRFGAGGRSARRDRRHTQHALDFTRQHDPAETFRCRHCRLMVGPAPWGGPHGGHRNHCPFCLYSRHVDGKTPGDRASECGAKMAPIGAFIRGKGEYVIVHRCLRCGFERHCRVAADDDFEAVLALPALKPRVKK